MPDNHLAMEVDPARQTSALGVAKAAAFWTGVTLLLTAVACGADGESYVQQNERLLETLPEIPGSERLLTESSPYHLYESPEIDGYTTVVVYRAPPEMTAEDVVNFYVDSLGGDWEHCVEEIPMSEGETGEQVGAIPTAGFVREMATVSIHTTAMVSVNKDGVIGGEPHTFEVAVDHQARTNLCTGEDLR